MFKIVYKTNRLTQHLVLNKKCLCKCYSSVFLQDDVSLIRNIGIMAHIDAGKTTTTERMLYFSGSINQMGEVHHGNTVTDYMEQERNRGITIKSAAVTFPWKKYQFNLIDTPGHIDFTMEVEQTLSVLDGAILVLDGSAGVEAQSLTVWRQANKYHIPRIAFVNKMDRPDANFEMSWKSILEKLDIEPLPLQIPFYQESKFQGVIDVLTHEKLFWDGSKNMKLEKSQLSIEDGQLYEAAQKQRTALIDKLSEYDDQLANKIIESESLDNISTNELVKAVRRVTIAQTLLPVLCGSAYKNIAIQPLMDGVALYLPSPLDMNNIFGKSKHILAAKAFKIIHDKQRGPLIFLRVYNGVLNKNQKFFNISQDVVEQGNKLLVAHANDFEEINSIGNGNIAVMTGLKHAVTGDFLTSSVGNANTLLANGLNEKMLNISVPDPVFFCSIEPPSLAYQQGLEQALQELQREDPSIRISHAEDTGQTVLAGMGELHIEIIKDRILKEYKIDADLGPLQISYREMPISNATEHLNYETKVGTSKQVVSIHLSLESVDDSLNKRAKKDILIFDKSGDAASNLAHLNIKHLNAIKQGIEVGLMHGPKIGAPLINAQFVLHSFMLGRGTTESMIAAASTQCVRKLLEKAGTCIMEPIMSIEISMLEAYASGVLADLNRKRATIQNIALKGDNKIIIAETPLSALMGFSTTIRTITSGTGIFSMEFLEYRKVDAFNEDLVIESVRGF